ncbi:MAG TPA: alpha-L-fucosidase, partial [bacterium]|nr:alpha-L-fucosidase [bacterium]
MNTADGGAVSRSERLAWFNQARFGLFIHWGLYSLLKRGEWVMYVERIPAAGYAKLARRFQPKHFDADAWLQRARAAGMRYAVLTTRHHDGFCLFDSRASDFTSVRTAAGRDFVAEYVEACRRAGLKVGLYYSLLDWRFPGYFNREKYPESFEAMVEQAHAQVRELLTNYGPIDILWYDGGWIPGVERTEMARLWRAAELNAAARRLQPGIIINNRSGLDEDIDTPEQHVTASAAGRAWETCMTMGDFCGWGYIRNNPNFKTATQLIQHLVQAAAGGGNFLLNIGPRPDGTLRNKEIRRLEEIGAWMQANGASIYGSELLPKGWGGAWGGGMAGTMTAVGR